MKRGHRCPPDTKCLEKMHRSPMLENNLMTKRTEIVTGAGHSGLCAVCLQSYDLFRTRDL